MTFYDEVNAHNKQLISVYMGSEYKHGEDTHLSVINEVEAMVPFPTAPPPPGSATAVTPNERILEMTFYGEVKSTPTTNTRAKIYVCLSSME